MNPNFLLNLALFFRVHDLVTSREHSQYVLEHPAARSIRANPRDSFEHRVNLPRAIHIFHFGLLSLNATHQSLSSTRMKKHKGYSTPFPLNPVQICGPVVLYIAVSMGITMNRNDEVYFAVRRELSRRESSLIKLFGHFESLQASLYERFALAPSSASSFIRSMTGSTLCETAIVVITRIYEPASL